MSDVHRMLYEAVKSLEWISARYDGTKTTIDCAMDAYDMACEARMALFKMRQSEPPILRDVGETTNERIRRDPEFAIALVEELKAEFANAIAHDEDKRDAERYRYLRVSMASFIEDDPWIGSMFPYGEDLDAAIDAAMNADKET